MIRIETRDTLADAHVRNAAPSLRHAVEVDADGIEVRVLCRRVSLDSLADAYAGDRAAPPTCPACLRAVHRARGTR